MLFIRLRDAHTHVWPLHSSSPSIYVTLVHTIVIAFFVHNYHIHDTYAHDSPASVELIYSTLAEC